MQKKLNAAIIGAGSIGGLIDSPNSSNIASHAHAYEVYDKTDLKAICEVDDKNIINFKQKWGEVNSYHTVEEMLENEDIDIVSISSPTQYHKENLVKLLEAKSVKYILCEKPLVSTYDELLFIKNPLKNSDKQILINLMRRYNSSFDNIADIIKSNELGKVLNFYGTTNKGLLHNGSHLLGVLQHFFGELIDLSSISSQTSNHDLYGTFSLKYLNAKGTIDILKDINYSIFELKIYCQNGVIEINSNDIKLFKSTPSKQYAGYNNLQIDINQTDVLSNYALDSLKFLIQSDKDEAKNILTQHIDLHKIILQLKDNG